jgi:hypothetical protein
VRLIVLPVVALLRLLIILDDAALPDDEFFAGQLLVPAHILREQVFEPVITKV